MRELKNAAERFVLLGAGVDFDTPEPAPVRDTLTLAERVDWFEKSLIEKALEQNRGSINATVEALGTPRKTLYDKMRKHQVDKNRFK